MWSQSRLGANFANGKRFPPWSLTRAMWVSTRAWARMSRSDSGAAGAIGPVSPVSVGVGVEQGSSRAGVEGFASYDQSEVVFGPFVGFDVFGEFDHMGTNPLGFRIVDLRPSGLSTSVRLSPLLS